MKYLHWTILGLVTLIMIPGGAMKVLRMEDALLPFSQLNLPIWFALVIGIAEIAGAIGIWITRTRRIAAIGLAVIMVGAVYYHVRFPPVLGALPALCVFFACLYILRQTWNGGRV